MRNFHSSTPLCPLQPSTGQSCCVFIVGFLHNSQPRGVGPTKRGESEKKNLMKKRIEKGILHRQAGKWQTLVDVLFNGGIHIFSVFLFFSGGPPFSRCSFSLIKCLLQRCLLQRAPFRKTKEQISNLLIKIQRHISSNEIP